MKNKNRLSVTFQYGGRPYIEKIARDFLKESLGDIDYEWLELDCSRLTIGAGYNRLAEQVKTDYVITVLDDFGFFPNGDWVEKGIIILKNRSNIGRIHLRKENDYKELGTLGGREEVKGVHFYIYNAWDNRGWSINPSLMRTETLKKIIPLDEKDLSGNIAEKTGWDRWKDMRLSAVKLDIPYKGVCFHLGWNRSCYFGYKDKQKKVSKRFYEK